MSKILNCVRLIAIERKIVEVVKNMHLLSDRKYETVNLSQKDLKDVKILNGI